jgi:hypothetical protein
VIDRFDRPALQHRNAHGLEVVRQNHA